MFIKMLNSVIYYILIVSFNHCCGASHLIPTAISSAGHLMRPMASHLMNMGALNTAAANSYSMYSLPYNMNGNIPLQFSATYSQPTIDIPRIFNIRNISPNVNTNTQNSAKKVEISATQRPVDLNSFSSVPLKYLSSRIIERQPKIISTQQMPTIGHKPVNTQYLKPQTSTTTTTTLSPNHHKYRTERVVKPVITISTTKRPTIKLETNMTTAGYSRIHTISYNHWPKTVLQTNFSYVHKDSQRDRPQTPQQFVAKESERQTQEKSYYINQQMFDYNTESPQLQTLYTRQETPTTTVAPKVEPIVTTPEEAKEELRESDKKDAMASVDSEQTYQFFDSHKEPNINYDHIPQPEPQLSPYGTPIDETNGIPNGIPNGDHNYPYFTNIEPEAEPEVHDHYNNNDKDISEHLIEDNNESQLKTLLEQFIQQLDLLRTVASKELLKTTGDSYAYGSNGHKNGEVISQTIIEPSVSKSGSTYDDYQNERSYEQNVANSEPKAYKDTYDKTLSKKPCKKPFHAGALPYTGPPL